MPAVQVNQMLPVGELSHQTLGYRDMALDFDSRIVVTCLHYTKVASRLDSYFSGLFKNKKTLPPGVEADQKDTVGVLQVLKLPQDMSEENSFKNFELQWEKNFPSQAICVAISSKIKIVAVGLDNGTVHTSFFDPDNLKDKEKYIEGSAKFQSLHSDRVMKLVIDEENIRLISIGKDKKIALICLKSMKVLGTLYPLGNPLFDIDYNPATQIAILAGSSTIYQLNLALNVPSIMKSITLPTSGDLRALHLDYSLNTILACSSSDGKIFIIQTTDLSLSQPEFKLQATFKSFDNCRCMVYIEPKKELYIGYDKGFFTVFHFDIPALVEKAAQESKNKETQSGAKPLPLYPLCSFS